MIEQYVMMELSIKYGIAILITIILFLTNSITFKKLIKALHDFRVISDKGERYELIKILITFALIMIIINFFVMVSAMLVRVTILSDGVSNGIIYLIIVVTIDYLATLIVLLLFFRIICNTDREFKKETFITPKGDTHEHEKLHQYQSNQLHEDDNKLGGDDY